MNGKYSRGQCKQRRGEIEIGGESRRRGSWMAKSSRVYTLAEAESIARSCVVKYF